jgi:hypothetical protein
MKALFLVLTAVACNAAGLNFPSVRSSISPDLRWLVRCVTEEQRDGFLHSVLLSRFGTTKEALVWSCARSCDVLWSADSERLAITDWTGSSLSEIYIVERSAPKARRLEVAAIEKLIQKDELEGHCYFEALRWEAEHQLAIRIFGHTDENPAHGFAYYLSVDTLSGVAKLVKKEDQEPNQTLQRNAGSRPSSGDSPASETPSSLGPRG